jgi:hypothetical protein
VFLLGVAVRHAVEAKDSALRVSIPVQDQYACSVDEELAKCNTPIVTRTFEGVGPGISLFP